MPSSSGSRAITLRRSSSNTIPGATDPRVKPDDDESLPEDDERLPEDDERLPEDDESIRANLLARNILLDAVCYYI
jgi:hypothetical protein